MQNPPPFWTAGSSKEIHAVVLNYPYRPVLLSPHPSLPLRVIFGDNDIVTQSILAMKESPMGVVELSMAQFGIRRTVVNEGERCKHVQAIKDAVRFIAEEFWARDTDVLEFRGSKKSYEICIVPVNPQLPSLPIAFADEVTLDAAVRIGISRSNLSTVEILMRPKTFLWLNHLAKDRAHGPSSC